MSRAQSGKDGLVVDARFNSGGMFPSLLIEQLARRPRRVVRERNGGRMFQPTTGIPGVQVLVVNGSTGSGGDSLAWLFQESRLGPVIGTRTWGGLVGWNFASPPLIDGGFVGIPAVPSLELDGRLSIEGRGVQPDIIVDADPGALARGLDPQLHLAIAAALARVQTGTRKARPLATAPTHSEVAQQRR